MQDNHNTPRGTGPTIMGGAGVGDEVDSVVERALYVHGSTGPVALALILRARDGLYYLTFTRRVARAAGSLLLASPFVDEGSHRFLMFPFAGIVREALAFKLRVSGRFDLDLFTEELRAILTVALGTRVKTYIFPAGAPAGSPAAPPRIGGGDRDIYVVEPASDKGGDGEEGVY